MDEQLEPPQLIRDLSRENAKPGCEIHG